MTTIYTASATNNGFYMQLITRADDETAARTAFEAVLSAPEDEGGDYTLGDDVTERTPDEDGDYDIGMRSYYSADEIDGLFALTGADNLGHGVILLESGGNG